MTNVWPLDEPMDFRGPPKPKIGDRQGQFVYQGEMGWVNQADFARFMAEQIAPKGLSFLPAPNASREGERRGSYIYTGETWVPIGGLPPGYLPPAPSPPSPKAGDRLGAYQFNGDAWIPPDFSHKPDAAHTTARTPEKAYHIVNGRAVPLSEFVEGTMVQKTSNKNKKQGVQLEWV